MAMQMTHLLLAAPLFKQLKAEGMPPEDLGQFLAGVLFPDIRYVSHLSREETHSISNNASKDQLACFYQTILQDLAKKDFFKAGAKFHAFCDCKRLQVLEEKNLFKQLDSAAWHLIKTQAPGQCENVLKLLEDVLAFNRLDPSDRKEMLFCLQYYVTHVDFEQKMQHFNIDKATFNKWYTITYEYLNNLTPMSRNDFCMMLGKNEWLMSIFNQARSNLQSREVVAYFDALNHSIIELPTTHFMQEHPLNPLPKGELTI